MPTYKYQCRECGYELEAFQQMKDNPLEQCPVCGGHLVRLIGKGGGIIFKGKGFYQTDYTNTKVRS